MSLKQIFKKVLIPCAAGLTADNHTYGPNCVQRTEESRPSSLPIYSNECSICGKEQKKSEPPSPMEEAVGNIRKELWVWQDNIKGYRHKFVDVYNDGCQQIDCPGGVVPEKCVSRNHLEQSLDDSCYPLLPCPDVKPPKTKEVKEFKCYKPSWPIGKKEKKTCIERCSTEKTQQPQQTCGCTQCQEATSGCGSRK